MATINPNGEDRTTINPNDEPVVEKQPAKPQPKATKKSKAKG